MYIHMPYTQHVIYNPIVCMWTFAKDKEKMERLIPIMIEAFYGARYAPETTES